MQNNMGDFLDSLEVNTNKNKTTANGAVTNDSSLDYVLDFFSQAGAMRGKPGAAHKLFLKAYSQDKNLALKALFYLRDVRGGQGERELFRYIFERLDSDVAIKLTPLVPEYGRWDDFEINKNNIEVIRNQISKDLKSMKAGEPISLMSKWLPSANASSKSRKKALKIIELLGVKESQYRKLLSGFRKYISLLEQDMSSRKWSEIELSKLPSQAFKRHIAAFKRHPEVDLDGFLTKVEKGEEKVNSGTLYTYEIYDMLGERGYYDRSFNLSDSTVRSANALWNNLPDYTNGKNAIVVADVSGSMTGRPMSVSVSLALYFAERNKGPFKDYFMTFSEKPKLQKIVGNDLLEKLNNLESSDWGMSTNIEAVFREILNAAKSSRAARDEMPKTLYIISDMQFNTCIRDSSSTNFDNARSMFEEAGYELPTVVFWNVNSYGDSPATKFDKNVTLISGFSQSTFRYAVEGKSPIESMMDILNSVRYEKIVV